MNSVSRVVLIFSLLFFPPQGRKNREREGGLEPNFNVLIIIIICMCLKCLGIDSKI